MPPNHLETRMDAGDVQPGHMVGDEQRGAGGLQRVVTLPLGG